MHLSHVFEVKFKCQKSVFYANEMIIMMWRHDIMSPSNEPACDPNITVRFQTYLTTLQLFSILFVQLGE